MSLLKPALESLVDALRVGIDDRLRLLERLPFRLRLKRLERVPRLPWRPRPIPTKILPITLAIIAAGGWLYYRTQMGTIEAVRIPGDAQAELEVAKMRLDAIRSTLTVAAGLGGAAALVLGFRKQQHEEFHTTQQRIMELRVHAVEQLTAENATVRKNGLLTLERLGEQHEELRRSVLDEICNYLRRPYDPTNLWDLVHQEREVRRKAQEILQRRLSRALGPGEYWSHDRIDLTGAHLRDADFHGCHLVNADFSAAVFGGDKSSFARASFSGKAVFAGARFGESTDFNGATFLGGADFALAAFKGAASFRSAAFGESAQFAMASFHGRADFFFAVFDEEAVFDTATFHDAVSFKYVSFLDALSAREVKFHADANFDEIEVRDEASFQESVLYGATTFEAAKFRRDFRFDSALIKGRATFLAVNFENDAHFESTDVQGLITFWGSTFNGNATFEGTSLTEVDTFDLVSFWRPLGPSAVPAGWRLRKLPPPNRYHYMVRDEETDTGAPSELAAQRDEHMAKAR
jgi:uncharacterized protein YjbI with pentapeptide repeats